MSIATPAPALPATIDDLLKVEGKAELIGGRIVQFVPSGHLPIRVGFKIAMSLEAWTMSRGMGTVYTDGIGFAIRPALASGRQSFSPDASVYVGAAPPNPMRFVEGAPLFAVEVRSENDYVHSAELEMAAKRDDYFEAGAKVVWDVDPQAKEVRAYRFDAALTPVVFRSGEVADAEPALPGWRITVDEIFA